MAGQTVLQRARLIPVSGIGTVQEAEQRATSALLAVLTVVRDLSDFLLTPLGASRAQRAQVEAYTEVQMLQEGRRIRPDGLIRVSFGKSVWSCLVEVKTHDNPLEADQINSYWDLARTNRIDHVLTISNEIASTASVHPTEGLRVRANSKVSVSHLSWSAILTAAIRIQHHKGVNDPEQAWILGELIRYLQHPASGALDFADMGRNWVAIRDGARSRDLSKRSEGIEDVSGRWDQLLRFAALRLSAEVGEDVLTVVPRNQRESNRRLAALVDSLVTTGTMSGGLRIPNTAGDIEVLADLRARQVSAAMEVSAPEDRGAVGRVTWLVRQLSEAPERLIIEGFPKNARSGTTTTLAEAREVREAALDEDKREPHRFRLTLRRDMGMARSTGGKNPGFIASVIDLIGEFYERIGQVVVPWQPPAPKVKRSAEAATEATPEDETVAPLPAWFYGGS